MTANEKTICRIIQHVYKLPVEVLFFPGGIMFASPSKEAINDIHKKLNREFETELDSNHIRHYLYVYGTMIQIIKELKK